MYVIILYTTWRHKLCTYNHIYMSIIICIYNYICIYHVYFMCIYVYIILLHVRHISLCIVYINYIYIWYGTCSIPTSPNCFFQDTFAFQFRLQQISHTSFQASPPLHRRSGEPPHRSRCRDGEVGPFAAVTAAVEAVLAPEVTTPGEAEMGRASPLL